MTATVCPINPPGHMWDNGLTCRWCHTTRTPEEAILSQLASRRGGNETDARALLDAYRVKVLIKAGVQYEDCTVCGAAHSVGKPCGTCEFNARMAAEAGVQATPEAAPATPELGLQGIVHAALSSVQGTSHHLGLVTLQVLTDRVAEAVTPLVGAESEAYDGELAMLRGLVRTLRTVIRDDASAEKQRAEVRRLLHHHADDDAAARKQGKSRPAAAIPFFQPGHTYTREHHGRTIEFLVRSVDTAPGSSYRIARGWRLNEDGNWEPTDSDDLTGWTDTTEAGEDQ